jgi:hypothetical protein
MARVRQHHHHHVGDKSVACHPLIDRHLAILAGQLPPTVVDELADGLIATWHRMVAAGHSRDEAAHAAIRDFGEPTQIVDAFIASSPGRRMARSLIYTAPLVAVWWAASLIFARAWTWPIPLPVAASLGVVLTLTVVALIVSANQPSYRRTHLGIAGGVGALLVDTGMLALVVTTAPVYIWPMAGAIVASITRSTLTFRFLLQQVAH